MKISRLKNTVIVILALANAVLLVLLLTRRAQERAARERTVEQLILLYAESGVELPRELVPLNALRLSAAEPARSLDSEAAFASALLGACSMENVGGGIYRYVGESGQCLIRSSGAVEAELERPVDDPAAFAESLFSAYGYLPLSVDIRDGSGTADGVCTLGNTTVFNAKLSLAFRNGRLCAAEGVLTPGVEPAAHGEGISGVTALVRCLDYSRSSGEVFTAVTGVAGGYLLQSTTSASLRLIPAWQITTDVANYYVNAMTGEVSRET